MKSRFLSVLCLCALLGNLGLPLMTQAHQLALDPGFDPNHVLEDDDIFDVNGMSYDRLVNFLRSKGTLADKRLADIDGVPKTVPEIIWRVANSYKINPKYLLALIQKEQSLVEDPAPTQKQFDWAAGYAICDNCSKNDPSLQEFKGFASQLEWAAKQHREKYLQQILATGATKSGKAPGKPFNASGYVVIPDNAATAMLYTYTPHVSGNMNLWRIWRRWFSLRYPDGTVVRAKESGTTYLIRLGEKRPFASRAVLSSLVDPDKIVELSDTEVSAYPTGPEIKFPKYALLRDPKNAVWLLTGDARRLIADMKTFRKFGFNEDEIEDVEASDLEGYPVGDPITIKTEFPQGIVMQDSTTKQYWYVEDTGKQLIPDKAFLALYFPGRRIKTTTAKKLAAYATKSPYTFHSGELVKTKKKSSLFVVENDILRPIPSMDVFNAMGWKTKSIVTVPDKLLSSYTIGDPFQLEAIITSPPPSDLAETDTTSTNALSNQTPDMTTSPPLASNANSISPNAMTSTDPITQIPTSR